MKQKIIFLFCLMFISLNFISAVPPVSEVQQFPNGYLLREQQYHVFEYGKPLRYGFFLENASNGKCVDNSTGVICVLTISNPQGFNTIQYNLTWQTEYNLWGIELNETQVLETFPEIGYYNYAIYCQNDAGGGLTGEFLVTNSGEDINIYKIFAYITLIVFFSMLFIGYTKMNEKVDYDKWENKIISKYENKNYIKMVLSSIGYNLLKHKFVIYYLLGIPIIVLISQLTSLFNIAILINFTKILNSLYIWSAIIVGLYFFGMLQEWLKGLWDKLSDMSWGVSK